jgi:hypothetical protein
MQLYCLKEDKKHAREAGALNAEFDKREIRGQLRDESVLLSLARDWKEAENASCRPRYWPAATSAGFHAGHSTTKFSRTKVYSMLFTTVS